MDKNLEMKIADVRFSNNKNTDSRIHNILESQKIMTLGDLAMRSEKEVLLFPGMGRAAVNKIWDVLEEKGLSFAEKNDSAGSDAAGDKTIDWEQRRYEIARDVLASYKTCAKRDLAEWTPEERAKEAVRQADALVGILKTGIG